MFKLLRIVGANNSAPEIITVNAPYATAVHAGNIYYLSNGSVTCDRTSEPVRFVSLESLDENHNQKKLHGFLVTPGMIFEADFVGDIANMFVSEPFSFHRNDVGDIEAICIPSDGDGNAEGIIYSREGSARANKLQVLFT